MSVQGQGGDTGAGVHRLGPDPQRGGQAEDQHPDGGPGPGAQAVQGGLPILAGGHVGGQL